jgi:hypothetical protein
MALESAQADHLKKIEDVKGKIQNLTQRLWLFVSLFASVTEVK